MLNTIRCKQPLLHNLVHPTCINGFEGPAINTLADDGFGNTVQKGQLTSSYNTWMTEKEDARGYKYFDGEIEIYDTPSNRKKIAASVRGGNLKVLRADIEAEILAEHPASAKAKREEALKPVDAEYSEVADEHVAIEAPSIRKQSAAELMSGNEVKIQGKRGRKKMEIPDSVDVGA
jgi:hypothetical protein